MIMMKEAGQGLVGPLVSYSMPHLDYGRFQMNGGKQSLNRFSREARRTGEIHLATGQFP